MAKLSDIERLVLTTAAQCWSMMALPLPKGLEGAAAQKVIASLLEQGLLEEIDAIVALGEPVWRKTEDGYVVTLVMTEYGVAALGIGSVD
jgi:hypothetical protein